MVAVVLTSGLSSVADVWLAPYRNISPRSAHHTWMEQIRIPGRPRRRLLAMTCPGRLRDPTSRDYQVLLDRARVHLTRGWEAVVEVIY